MTNKKRKSKAGGGGGGTGETAVAAAGGGGGGGGASSNAHKRPRFYDRSKNDTGSNSREGASTNYSSSRFTNDTDKQRGYYDPTHGQFGAFPGLEGDDDGEFYGPANDGVDYLKMVRSEAKSVPTLLIAGQQYQVVNTRPCLAPSINPQRSVDPSLDTLDYDDNGTDNLNYEDEPAVVTPEIAPSIPLASEEPGNELPEVSLTEDQTSTPLTPSTPDSAGWYYDGTYTAAPPPPASTPPTTALSLWHASLLNSFRTFRHTFHTTPPISFKASDLPPIAPNLKSWVRQRRWQSYILHTAPTPRMLRAMSQLHTISAMEALTGAPGVKKGVQGWWAEWVWGLLVRCEICLTAEEVSVVRELGKRALSVRERIVSGEGGHWREEAREETMEIEEKEGEEEEDPVGWVEPGEEEEREEGEVEGGESDNAKFDQATVKEPMKMVSRIREGEQVEIESEVKTKPSENFVANPDSIDLDLADEPEVAANLDVTPSPGKTNLGPDPLGPPSPIPIPAPQASVPNVSRREERTLADTLGALDMVISIVGDFFGQRDLLGERNGQAGLVMV